MTPSNMKEKIGKKGETVTSPLTTGAGTFFCMPFFHSITTPFFKISQWCNEVVLVFFARITKKIGKNKKKEQGEKGDVP